MTETNLQTHDSWIFLSYSVGHIECDTDVLVYDDVILREAFFGLGFRRAAMDNSSSIYEHAIIFTLFSNVTTFDHQYGPPSCTGSFVRSRAQH